MKVRFTIPGPPKGKGRPRMTKLGHTYTPQDTANYENLVKVEYQRQCGAARFGDDEYVDLRIIAYYPIPTSASKKRQRMMAEGVLRPAKKPDQDNVLKIVADSLNHIAYKDDVQVVDAQVRKFYSTNPRVVVILQTAGGEVA